MNLSVKSAVSKNIPRAARRGAVAWLAAALVASAASVAQSNLGAAPDGAPADEPVQVTTTAERVRTAVTNGKVRVELLPADRLVGGDEVIYTLEVRNRGAASVEHYAFTSPIPAHMSYVANTAVAPGADITYSVDGGRSFDLAENLTVHGADGKQRPATAEDYTHIRWALRNRLKAGSMTLARFRAVVKS
jgi:uncharacterized repeat protein (TIGR01451 family)